MKTLPTALATATVAALLAAAPAGATDPQPPSRPRAVHLFLAQASDQIRIGWLEPARTGSDPILRYVIRSNHGDRVTGWGTTDVTLFRDLEPGRYVFKVKAVSRAGSSPWTKSAVAYVE